MKKLMTGLVFILLVLNLSAEKITLLKYESEVSDVTGIHQFYFYCIDGYKYVVLEGDAQQNGTLTQMFEHKTVWGANGGPVPMTCSNK